MEIDKIKQAIDALCERTDEEDWTVISTVALNELKALIEPEKWEPERREGNRFIDNGGLISISGVSHFNRWKYGNEWPTKELAESARDMNKRNQLILQAKTERGFGDGEFVIMKDNKWEAGGVSGVENPELTFDTKEHAEEVIKMLQLNEN